MEDNRRNALKIYRLGIKLLPSGLKNCKIGQVEDEYMGKIGDRTHQRQKGHKESVRRTDQGRPSGRKTGGISAAV